MTGPLPVKPGRTDGDDLVVATTSGRVRGALADGLRCWRGIPYAQPPAGQLRFSPPQPPADWGDVRPAIDPAPVAWQSDAANPITGQPLALDRNEDCLYLNITVPAGPAPAAAGYPVLVWIHGGGYVQGSGAGELTGDAAGLARCGLVVVTFNYRLGSLGFLDLTGLGGAGLTGSGQAGFLDQVAALRFVHANVTAFGGDPARVTVYGVSAGAKSVANLVASPLAAGLISRAISSSGGAEHVATPAQAGRVRARLVRELGLRPDDRELVARLRAVPAAELIAAQEAIAAGPAGTWVWRPAIGPPGIPVLPIDAIMAGSGAGIPMLIGSNGSEAASYQLMDRSAAQQAPRVLAGLFGPAAAAEMLAGYPAARPGLDETGIRLAVMSAERYDVPTQRLALAQSAHAPVWRYRFDGCPPGMPAELAGGHGLDLMAVWGADGFAELASAGDPQARLSAGMAAAWAAFSRGGPPAGPAWPEWPQFTAADQRTMILDQEPHIEAGPRAAEFRLWQGRTWSSGTWWPLDGI